MKKIISKKTIIILIIFLGLAAVGIYHTHKKLPAGVDIYSQEYKVAENDIDFLYDLTYQGEDGNIIHEQKIFDKIIQSINEAKEYILIDMFLFNDYSAKTDKTFRRLSDELTNKLIEKKSTMPDIKIDFITDPINIVYNGGESAQVKKLKKAGINMIITDLSRLRDSNFLYSSLWRTFFKFFGNSPGGWVKHPFSNTEPGVTIRSYLSLLNFKANHRKIFTADNNGGFVSIITSANPHDGSSAHSNVAFSVKGDFAGALYNTESQIAKMSGEKLNDLPKSQASDIKPDNIKTTAVRLISENKIKETLLREINNANGNTKIKIAQFYLADREIIKSLIKASAKGAEIKIILDPNKDAFGYKKNGIPNRQSANELVKKSDGRIQVRWYDTHGEQFHTKIFIAENADNINIILGSANLTRRNLDNFNLELDVYASMPKDARPAQDASAYFSKIWNNEDGIYTVDYEKYQDNSRLKTLIYRMQEVLGISSF